jgi:nucleoside-diphosphate-sugar epimerase
VRIAGLVGDAAAVIRRREPDVNSAATTMSMLAHNFSCRRAEAELGYRYRSLDETAADAWQWFVDRGYTRRGGGSPRG